jgi:hypothetical protein
MHGDPLPVVRILPLRVEQRGSDSVSHRARICPPGPKCLRSLPSCQIAYYHFRQFCRIGLWTHLYRALRVAEHRRVDKDPHLSAAIMDLQSVKTVEESGRIHVYDAHTCVRGCKCHQAGGYLELTPLLLRMGEDQKIPDSWDGWIGSPTV